MTTNELTLELKRPDSDLRRKAREAERQEREETIALLARGMLQTDFDNINQSALRLAGSSAVKDLVQACCRLVLDDNAVQQNVVTLGTWTLQLIVMEILVAYRRAESTVRHT